MREGFIGPGAYVTCPVFDCEWKLNTDQEGSSGTALFTGPADSMDDAIRRAALDKAAELELAIKVHVTTAHPNIVTDLMRTIRHLNRRLAAKDPGTGVDIRLNSDQAAPALVRRSTGLQAEAGPLRPRNGGGAELGVVEVREGSTSLVPATRPRGICPGCDTRHLIRDDGTIGRHLNMATRSADQLYCEGTGKPPKQPEGNVTG